MHPLLRTLPLMLFPVLASAAPLTIDVTTPVNPPAAAPYGPGTSTDPHGHTISADSRSLLLDGKPWIPVGGEFHYSRYPRDEWRDELLKMKAGGISVVSTYVFWIHQQQYPGPFDWTGRRSLRDFLLLCQELGLKVVVRLGPWCHGEMRNGGIPDWVQHSGAKLRSTDPKFMSLVESLYKEEAAQMQGLLWKDGGPVIGVQLDNECNNAPYLLALKKLAQSVGIDVPYYAITGWQITVPAKEFLPFFGGYADGFWGGTPDSYRREFMFTPIRATNNLGAQMNDKYASNSKVIDQFPYLCVEIGPGMMSSYAKRIKIDPDVVTAMALTKLGCGNNMPGYYMYHGGNNPDSAHPPDNYMGSLDPSLQETHPNFMPLKDYDFQTALGAAGQVREQFHLLLEQHLFLQDFGSSLARMPAFFPDVKPTSLTDFDTLRWDVRSDGTSGFLFFSNEQPYIPLAAHQDVQFQVKTSGGLLTIPLEPITIPSGSYGFFPFNLDCDGVTLAYATAQPLCRIDAGAGRVAYFFAALKGIAPDIEVAPSGMQVNRSTAGADTVVQVTKPNGGTVEFIVLTPEQSQQAWRTSFGGQERLVLSNATVLTDGTMVRLQAQTPSDFALSIFPPVPSVTTPIKTYTGTPDGPFTHYVLDPPSQPVPLDFTVTQTQPADPALPALSGTLESTWDKAAVYKLDIPAAAANRHVIMDIHYVGDAARLYIGGQLFDDNFYNGDPFSIPLWRIPKTEWPMLSLKVIPWSDALASRMPQQAKDAVAAAKAGSSMDKVTVTTSDQMELPISP